MASDREDLRTDFTTLTNDILHAQQCSPEATGDLTILLSTLASSFKWISNVVRKAELMKVIGVTGTTNVQAENQQKLDILTNQIMCNLLRDSGKAAVLISEEDEEAIIIPDAQKGNYCVCFDPLDGSSNIDCGVSIGTIFGIYHVKDTRAPAGIHDVLRAGGEMVAAGYCLYGSSTVLVLTFANSKQVNGYTLDPHIGEFVLTHPKVKLGKKKIYSCNEGNVSKFDKPILEYLQSVKYPPPGHTGPFTPYSARYVGSMVADVHRTLLYGGVFLYPNGKLRILYECFPMALLVENAGGKASTGRERILDIIPDHIHARSGIILGNTEEVEAVEALYKKFDAEKK
ncbi:fructose-1,6-bisphosphatase, cytosolic-like protein [Blyttiomyces helicus]|uniref:Fructose-1,6-bisphosphatase n=1 Tax=Blyttiomyces helicus TaxID=388810 RepID=A0A4V1ISS9_9FUNG|nr:fructose-1,6-bisphosphatase, cytosolic-like protein [Blyttiomyces helicus]|eukprot:RKO94617.1 fructose-1,6-bisphosphatase, cytosolic-like protein [Blyttiomyces helicus]